MTRSFVPRALAAAWLTAVAACGETQGSVLERVPETETGDAGSTPPGTQLRADVLVVRDIASCAIGQPCRTDPDMRGDTSCFELNFDDGGSIGFRADTLLFVAPDDPRIFDAEQAQCFDLTLDDQAFSEVRAAFEELRTRIYQQSGDEILLDVRVHEIPSLLTGLVLYENEWGIYLPTDALASSTTRLSRDTDFVFAVSGFRDPERGVAPSIEHCAGTVRSLADGLAGAGYTWLTTECAYVDMLVRHWMFQVRYALRDANDFNDEYDGYYPWCGEAYDPPESWFPSPNECSVDPDAPTCGDNRCDGSDDEFVTHVLHAHWPRRRAFVGNHCNDGKRDFDETDVDVGGACEPLGR
jgi:hypothetical protein